MAATVDYRLLERFLAAQRRNTDGRYDIGALERLRTVVELRRDDRRHERPARAASVLPFPLAD